jgi:hypothetical protein
MRIRVATVAEGRERIQFACQRCGVQSVLDSKRAVPLR